MPCHENLLTHSIHGEGILVRVITLFAFVRSHNWVGCLREWFPDEVCLSTSHLLTRTPAIMVSLECKVPLYSWENLHQSVVTYQYEDPVITTKSVDFVAASLTSTKLISHNIGAEIGGAFSILITYWASACMFSTSLDFKCAFCPSWPASIFVCGVRRELS